MAKSKKKGGKKKQTSQNSNSTELKEDATKDKNEAHMDQIDSKVDYTKTGNAGEESNSKEKGIAEVEATELNKILMEESVKREDEELQDIVEENERKSVSDVDEKDQLINSLQEEIIALKEQLEKYNEEKTDEISDSKEKNLDLEEELQAVKDERDELETQYNNLLNRISSMKTVFSKMKESQEELENVQEQIKEYESQNLKMKNKIGTLNKEKEELATTAATLNREFSSLEHEHETLQNKFYEYESKVNNYENELEDSKISHGREIALLEQEIKSLTTQVEELTIIHENDKQDINDLKEEKNELQQVISSNEDSQEKFQLAIKELENNMQNNENSYKEGLNERDLQIKSLRLQLDNKSDSDRANLDEISKLKLKIESMNTEIQEKVKLEEDSKNQALIIGKLRHEAIVLNEHLKKALGMLKQSSNSETVDRELISNLLISFVSIPRADPKKFEVLQLLSNFLNWDDEKKQQAGLVNNSVGANRGQATSRTQSFVSLWTDYLEKESER